MHSKPCAARAYVLAVCAIGLHACGGGSEDGGTPDVESTIELSGSVGDGPVVGAQLTVRARSGEVLASGVSDQRAAYTTQVKTLTSHYPLIVEATGGTDLVSNLPADLTLLGAMPEPSDKGLAHLNPFTTLAISTAKQMSGGLSSNNIQTAMTTVVTRFNSGLSTFAGSGPMSAPITDTNLAEIVRSSETLAETLRRTNASIVAARGSSTLGGVVESLGADLTDGQLDGRGASGVDPQVSAVAAIASAQVSIEAMTNTLRVGGRLATGALDQAINTLASRALPTPTASLPASAGLIDQAKTGVAAAVAIEPSAALEQLQTALRNVRAGMSPQDVAAILPSAAPTTLDAALTRIRAGLSADVQAVNSISATGGAATNDVAPTIIGSPPTSVLAGAQYSFTPTASDADGNGLTFSITNKPAWAAFSTSTGTLQGTPGSGDIGTSANIQIAVSDGQAVVSLPAFSITVSAPTATNKAPTITGTPPTTVFTGTQYTFMPTANDPDGNSLTFSITNKPAWATFNGATGLLQGTPSSVGTFADVRISVTDGQASASLPPFSIAVSAATPANRAPTISGSPATSVVAGTPYSFTPTASDPDGNSLTFAIANKPAWAIFSPASGALQGTPTSAGTFSNIRISVNDGQASASLAAFSITVSAAPVTNRPPTISGTPAGTVVAGTQYLFAPTATDPDNDSLTFSITNRPAWAIFSNTSGALQGTPTSAGTFSNIRISVSDGQASASLAAFSITVSAAPVANRPPTISGTPSTAVVQGSSYMFQPTAADPDGNALTFSIVNKPAWASFDVTTGKLSGAPGPADVGSYAAVTISVSDGQLSASLAAFSITVQAVATGSVTVSWNPPTTNTNGTALTNLAGYKIYWGTTSRNYSSSAVVTNPGIAAYVVEGLTSNTYYFAVSSLNQQGVESALSNEAMKVLP